MSKHSKCICTYEKMDEAYHKGAACFRPFCLLGKSPNPCAGNLPCSGYLTFFS